jgi:hypothetical protein
MRVLVTGSRDWTDWPTIMDAIEALPRWAVVVHGGARGADQTAGAFADAFGLAQEVFPADWKRHGKGAGPLRNQAMVDAGADIVYAFPLPSSRGTLDLIRRAEAAGIPVRRFL